MRTITPARTPIQGASPSATQPMQLTVTAPRMNVRSAPLRATIGGSTAQPITPAIIIPTSSAAGGGFRDAFRMKERLQPGRERHEYAEAEEHEAAQGAHRLKRPQRPGGAPLDGRVLGARMPGWRSVSARATAGYHGQHGLENKEPLEVPVAPTVGPSRRASEDAHENARRAHRDARRALIGRQVLARELAHRAEHDRLGDRDGDLPGHRPGEGMPAQANKPARAPRAPRPPASTGRNQRSSRMPAGIASTTYSSGKISASQPTALTDTP